MYKPIESSSGIFNWNKQRPVLECFIVGFTVRLHALVSTDFTAKFSCQPFAFVCFIIALHWFK